VETSDETPQREYVKSLESVEGLSEITARFLAPAGSGSEARGSLAAAMEFVLEGLHQHSMISKWEEGNRTAYRDMLKAMFDQMAVSDSN
jgi:magnesium chelatase subunit I